MSDCASGTNWDSEKSHYEGSKLKLIKEKEWWYLADKYMLSPRELEIARLICQGARNQDIAENLDIASGTVKSHLQNIYRKVRVNSKVKLLLSFLVVVNRAHTSSEFGAPKIPIVEKKPTRRHKPSKSDLPEHS